MQFTNDFSQKYIPIDLHIEIRDAAHIYNI